MPKRARITKVLDESDDEEEGAMVQRKRSKASQETTLTIPMDDNDDNESSDGNVSVASQNPDFVYGPTMADKCQIGNIQRVILKNFMCHHKLDIKFGPHVNFIIGRNGSGKSAVVTAIILGLGGKASTTSRGSTVKGFIKSGKQSAEIIIHLSNEGPDAYKPENYGNRIVIERKFSKDGASSYRIKSSSGQVVSTKREELRNILDYFNILVDNPVVILNQEVSRNFLHSKNPTDKYRFFLQATQLGQIQADYAEVKLQKNSAKEILSKKEESFPALESEVKEWEKKYKAFSALENQKEKIKNLKSEMAWSLVIEKEASLQPHLNAKKAEEARMPKFERMVVESTAKLKRAKAKMDEMSKESETLETDEKVLLPELKSGKQQLLNCKNKLRAKQAELKKLETNIKNGKQDREKIKERINEIKNSSLQLDYEAEKQRREKKIHTLKEKLEAIKQQKHAKEVEKDLYHEAVTKYKNDVYRVDMEMRNLKTAIEDNQRELNNLRSAVKNKLRKYGPRIPDVIARIHMDYKRGRFHRKPIGPVGEWIKLKDSEWALAVESCLKSLIHAFCVNDHDDSLQLEKIFKEVCPEIKPPLFIISQFQSELHDVSNHKPRNCPHPTVLDILEVKDSVVGNCLIDQRGIEHVILIKTAQEARDVMRNLQTRGVREAFTMEGDQIYPEPNYRYYSSNKERAQYLSTNVEDVISNCEQGLMEKINESKTLMERKNHLTSRVTTNMHEERTMENEIRRFGDMLRKFNLEIEELEMIEDPEPVDVLVLEEECIKISKYLETLKEKYNILNQDKEEIESESRQAEEGFRHKEIKLRELSAKLENFREDHANAQTEYDEAKSHHIHYENKKKEQEKKITNINKQIDKLQTEIKADEEKACLICPTRINTRRTTENIQSEITEINKRVEATEKRQGDRDLTTRRFHETKEALWKIKKEVGSLKKFLNHLDDVMEIRDKAYKSCRLVIALRMKQVFVVFLHSRQYVGQLSFDHENGTLDISVNPKRSEGGKSGKNVKSLSGGERSFATVCFILALWGGTESPFRCLDEFDVFMDMVNRRICMDMMLQVAKEQRARQFIFLTPQNMSYVVCPTAKIFRMPDPVRLKGGQRTLEQLQITDDDDEEDRTTS